MNLQPLKDFKNRHTDGLPEESCNMTIIVTEKGREGCYDGKWVPYKGENEQLKRLKGNFFTFSEQPRSYFHPLPNIDDEFVYYKIHK